MMDFATCCKADGLGGARTYACTQRCIITIATVVSAGVVDTAQFNVVDIPVLG